MITAWMTPAEEARAVRMAAARASCRVDVVRVISTVAGPRASTNVSCSNGWQAATMLLSLAVTDSQTAGARALAFAIRGWAGAATDEAYARAVHRYVLDNVDFVREPGEVFTGASYTIASRAGDCDDHARVVFALLRAGGVPARLAFLYKPGDTGPRHVVALAGVGGAWQWLETTLPARFGEHPYAAGVRLGVINNRSDIAKEVRTMGENDLPPVPAGFDAHTTDAQLTQDAAALAKLGFACSLEGITHASDPAMRAAVAAFQSARWLTVDGLIGPKTRAELRISMGQIGEEYSAGGPPTKVYTHAQAREALAGAFRRILGREGSDHELDFGLATALGETGYGRAGAANWANPGQFARWASERLYNWGALEQGGACPSGKQPYKGHYPSVAPTMGILRAGVDAGRPTCFWLFDSDDLAAEAFLRAWGAPDTLAAAATGSATAVAASMKNHGYYEGFWRPPGGLDANHPASKGFKEAPSAEDAQQKNIADYAALLSRGVAVVRGPGGVPDPSPDGPPLGAVVSVAAIVGVASALAWWIGK